MEKTGVQKLAVVLRVLVWITFCCNLLVLPLVPGMVGIGRSGGLAAMEAQGFSLWKDFIPVCWQYLFRVWREQDMEVLALFLLFCGACTAIILWQARRVLDTVTAQRPFCRENAWAMNQAAICFFLIAGAALARLVWGMVYYQSYGPIFTYNTLFIPVFTMGGLLCLVIGALVRQAAELKEENDLTI